MIILYEFVYLFFLGKDLRSLILRGKDSLFVLEGLYKKGKKFLIFYLS